MGNPCRESRKEFHAAQRWCGRERSSASIQEGEERPCFNEAIPCEDAPVVEIWYQRLRNHRGDPVEKKIRTNKNVRTCAYRPSEITHKERQDLAETLPDCRPFLWAQKIPPVPVSQIPPFHIFIVDESAPRAAAENGSVERFAQECVPHGSHV